MKHVNNEKTQYSHNTVEFFFVHITLSLVVRYYANFLLATFI